MFEQEIDSPMTLDEDEEEQIVPPQVIDPRYYECETIREGTEELNLTTEFNKAMHLRPELSTFEITSVLLSSNHLREVESVKNLSVKVRYFLFSG